NSGGANNESSSCSDGGSCKRPREIKTSVSRVCVKVDASDTSLIVKDGYQWRKYGQKVTRDNPSPRAYYKYYYSSQDPILVVAPPEFAQVMRLYVNASIRSCDDIVANHGICN
ncbi:WRKY transcription factor WRKY76, partial [Camellia lanceoleosa]